MREELPRDKPPADYSPEELDLALWLAGDLEVFCRMGKQLEIYRMVHRWLAEHPGQIGPLVLNCHRRLGKSFLLDLLLWERCLRYPGMACKFYAPSYKQGRTYLFDIHRQISRMCPPFLRPKRSGDTLVFRNPRWGDPLAVSELELIGVKDGGDSTRGPRANICVCDEVREWTRMEYTIRDVILFQLADQLEPLLLISTTPPASMAHPYVKEFIPRARARKTYFLAPARTTSDRFQLWYEEEPHAAEGNPDATDETEAMICEELHEQKESVTLEREWLCKLISDPERLIVPEFSKLKDELVLELETPAHFDAYEGIDFGWQDFNGVVFAYVDFLHNRLVQVDELWINNASTGQLSEGIFAKERKLWLAESDEKARNVNRETGERWRYRELSRVGDHSKQQLWDLWMDHDLAVLEAEKWDRDAALSQLRDGFRRRKIVIHPRCVHTIEQLEHGTWAETPDGRKKEFTRNAILGHCDLLAAWVYLYRKVSLQENPYPVEKVKGSTEFLAPDEPEDGRIVMRSLDLDFKPMR